MSDADNPSRPLANRGFLSLVITQFFGVVNDNLLKQVLTFGLAAAGVWSGVLREGGHSWVAMALVLPFLLFGAIAGQLAVCCSNQPTGRLSLQKAKMEEPEPWPPSFALLLPAFHSISRQQPGQNSTPASTDYR